MTPLEDLTLNFPDMCTAKEPLAHPITHSGPSSLERAGGHHAPAFFILNLNRFLVNRI
jgi:hypothetical protein